jgi:uncharacterized protein (TIGR02996 family)
MSVYFVYRCHDMGPTEKYLKRFDDETVLDWFLARWHRLADADHDTASARVEDELGCEVYRFSDLFQAVAEHALPLPQSVPEVAAHLDQHSYVNEVLSGEHVLQVYTDDDDQEMAYFFLDDHFLAEHGDRAAFLLNEGWRLPGGEGAGGFEPAEETNELAVAGAGEGTTYVAILGFYSQANLDDLVGGYRIEGVRLPGLARYLASSVPDASDDDPFELVLLGTLLVTAPESLEPVESGFLQEMRSDPEDDATWAAYSDWLQERGEAPVGPVLLRRAFERLGRYPRAFRYDLVVGHGYGVGKKLRTQRRDLATAHQTLVELEKERGQGRDEAPQSLIHVEEHLAQLCLHMSRGEGPYFHQWIFFDDLWAAAHPALANAVLRFARRWDVLSDA